MAQERKRKTKPMSTTAIARHIFARERFSAAGKLPKTNKTKNKKKWNSLEDRMRYARWQMPSSKSKPRNFCPVPSQPKMHLYPMILLLREKMREALEVGLCNLYVVGATNLRVIRGADAKTQATVFRSFWSKNDRWSCRPPYFLSEWCLRDPFFKR